MTRILHISDLHFGAEDPALTDALLEIAAHLKPDVTAAAGDFTQYGRRREFAAAAAFFDALPGPVVAAPGNHDTPYLDVVARAVRPWRRFEAALGGAVQPGWRNEGVGLEALHTARGLQARLDWSLGKARTSHVREAARRLTDVDGVRVVACHHPLIAPGGPKGRARTTGGARAAHLLAESGVDLVLTGHLHQVFALPLEREDGRVSWFIGAGTALSRRVRGEPAGFNVIDIDQDRAVMRAYAAEGGRFIESDVRELGFSLADTRP
ncbi:metallophosphoesterase [Alkalicaulis satelles]|uniref:Metallophosphoesterase n=1 Tax=Alkalicaulis satelles TaxID=2609175 RepID=A0A5M6ZP11_9PROT|nr:metallophosphoesterase [Alkalicaulis satelles]KAA5804958.1 metallophosphoesterase [Alkalicaulis satelles]